MPGALAVFRLMAGSMRSGLDVSVGSSTDVHALFVIVGFALRTQNGPSTGSSRIPRYFLGVAVSLLKINTRPSIAAGASSAERCRKYPRQQGFLVIEVGCWKKADQFASKIAAELKKTYEC
jgi:hypothetical protein